MSHNKEEFLQFLSRSITEISLDTKILFEMLDDTEFSAEARLLVAGALTYLLSPGDLVPDTLGTLGHVDDSLVLRMAMGRCLADVPERRTHYEERYPEVFESLERDLGVAAAYLGDLYPWLEEWASETTKIEYKGKKPSAFVDDLEEGTWLYDEVNEALLDLEVDEDELRRELRHIERILPLMREKMAARQR